MDEQIQPSVLPRPSIEALNISYRRIPFLSLGRDVFIDTRMILRKLEARFPGGETFTPEQKALLRLFERWTSDAGVFARAVQLIPTNLPTMQDPKFLKDRQELNNGRPFSVEVFQR